MTERDNLYVTLNNIHGVLVNESSCIAKEDVEIIMPAFEDVAVRVKGWDKENNMALKHGFSCVPSKTRGYNWCSFEKIDTQVWSVKKGWHRKVEHDPEYGGKRVITKHKTLEHALKGELGIIFKVIEQ